MSKNIGKITGAALFAGATAAIWLWPSRAVQTVAEEQVRPVRSAVVGAGMALPDRYFAGQVKANENRKLSFKQSGRVQRIPVSAGDVVKKGTKLAWLDPLDLQNNLAIAEAAAIRDRLSCERKREAAKKNAISKEELSQAEAQLHQSEMHLDLAKRALSESVITAPFDGKIAKVPGSELAMVTPSDVIIVFLDMSKVKIDVSMPESTVINARRLNVAEDENGVLQGVTVSFDSVPGRSYPVKFVEYVSTAENNTQTYVATYVMDTPQDLVLLPGMSATLKVRGDACRALVGESSSGVTVPESAIGSADDGNSFVWVLEQTQDNAVWSAKRRPVTISHRHGGVVAVEKGLSSGERVATAGVSVLTEGRKVRLIAE